jgi:hypothetical protein
MKRKVLWIGCALLLAGCAEKPRTEQAQADAVTARDAALAEQWGVEIIGVWRSAKGYMLDFRYRVLDPEKALPLLKRGGNVRPYLIDQATGTQLFVPSSPKVGPLRQTTQEPTAGRVYYALFANPGAMVESGDKVTVVIGDFRAEDIVVQ